MAFFQLVGTALKLNRLKNELVEEKLDAIKVKKKEKPTWRLRHITVDIRVGLKRFFRRALSCFFFEKFCYRLRHDGSCENYTLKSVFGFISGYVLTYIFFMFCVFQLDFKITTATIMCSLLGCILTIGLAFSSKVRCIVLLTLPQFFSQRGRQALLAYAFILAISGPAKNTLNNMGILSESLACGQEQLKNAVRQIIDAIKKPFLALRDAIKKLVKTVKEIVKKIKEILLTIKRIIMAIVRVIKAAFEFLAKIINICNKELGTPFERCTRVFENAIADCNAKLGPLFNWLCSLTYIVKSVCYLVKFLDYICILVDFISNSVIGVVIRKVKTFIRHIRTMFYVRIKFSHSFQFHTNTSRTMAEVAHDIVAEIRDRTRLLVALFNFMTSAATLFFVFMIVKIKFLTSAKFDNRYITKDFRELDTRRAKLGKETVLPLNKREMAIYVPVDSGKLAKTEKKALSKAITTLASASLKLAIFMAVDYCLFWILNLIKYYGRFQSKVQAPNIPTAHISGHGLLADLLRGIVRAFQPLGIQLEIDTVPCLPTPIPPNYDRYVQIATLLVLCWILTVLEPYGLRLRQMIMCYYHPTRAKERAIWLYNHIMRSRNSFLKFARRQLRRKVMGEKGIEKITCKEFLSANFKLGRLCFGEGQQTACLMCGHVFRESDDKKPIRCQTPGCSGIYCEQCFSDLQNLCTICLSPIEYGDMSDISEEKDSSEEESKKFATEETKTKGKEETYYDTSAEEDIKTSLLKNESDESNDEHLEESKKQIPKEKPKDSDYYSSEDSTDYSYSYQYKQPHERPPDLPPATFKDVEKQEIPDYASMESFREELPGETKKIPTEEHRIPETIDKAIASPSKTGVGTTISGTTFDQRRRQRHINFIGISSESSESESERKKKLTRRPGRHERMPLKDPKLCVCSDTSGSDIMDDETPLIVIPKSTTSTTTKNLHSPHSTTTDDNDNSPPHIKLDPEVRDDLKYVHMLIPELDLSELTESERNTQKPCYAVNKFSNVNFEEISETPRSIVSSINLSSSTNISPLRDELVNIPDREQEIKKDTPVKKDVTFAKTSKSEHQISSSSVDSYNFENNQRERVKQYYKAVKDIPSKKVEEKKKPNTFMRLIQKIIPKRRKNPDELPLYTKNSEVIELKSYNYTEDQWDTLSTSISSSPYVRQEASEPPESLTSSDDDKEESRVRGGESGLIKNPLPEYKTGYIRLRKLPQIPEQQPLITKDLLSKYFVSIEDLTPTRDCGPMSTARTLQPIASYGTEEVLIREVPEKDEPQTSAVSLTNTPGTSTDSNLSDSLCRNILGKHCKAFRKKKISAETLQTPERLRVNLDTLYVNTESVTESKPPDKKLSDIVSESIVLAQSAESEKVKTDNLVEENLVEITTTEIVTNNDLKRPSVASQASITSEKNTNQIAQDKEDNEVLMRDSTKDQKLQTFPVPILKFKLPSDNSLITLKEPDTSSQTSQPCIGVNGQSDTTIMDTPDRQHVVQKKAETQYPVRESCKSQCRGERILLTSDKMQQTSDDEVHHSPSTTKLRRSIMSNMATVGSNTCAANSTKTGTCSSSNRASTFIETTEHFQPTSSSNRCESSEATGGSRFCGCCTCPPPPPPQCGYASLKEKCYRSVPPSELSSKYKDRHHKYNQDTPSEHAICSKTYKKVYRDVPLDDEFDFCDPQYNRSGGHSSEYSRRSRPVDSDRQRRRLSTRRETCSCTGDCECWQIQRIPRQSSSPSHRFCTLEYHSSSSEISDPPDDDDYFSDGPPNRFDLPYQNNDDYLELVQELEETLQSRNRNRVRRAMKEFEHRSKCNKPLEQPIINYDETSESEEPIIEKLSKLTSERMGCRCGEMCSCRGNKSRHFGKTPKGQQRPRSGGYSCATRCRQIPGGDPSMKTHWQLDKNSGEWYKVSEHPYRHKSGRRSKTPSPQRGYCPYNCTCSTKRDYR